jgi:hypothetical protein
MSLRALAPVLLALALPAPPASAADPHVVAAVAGTFTYRATAADNVILCTEVAYDSGPFAGRTRYWSPRGGLLPGNGGWLDGPVQPSSCALAIPLEPNDDMCPPLLLVDAVAGTDLAGVWQDCEPYEPGPSVTVDTETAGRRCALHSVPDLTTEGAQVAAVDAGPLMLLTGGGTLRCAVYVNGTFAAAVSAHSV